MGVKNWDLFKLNGEGGATSPNEYKEIKPVRFDSQARDWKGQLSLFQGLVQDIEETCKDLEERIEHSHSLPEDQEPAGWGDLWDTNINLIKALNVLVDQCNVYRTDTL